MWHGFTPKVRWREEGARGPAVARIIRGRLEPYRNHHQSAVLIINHQYSSSIISTHHQRPSHLTVLEHGVRLALVADARVDAREHACRAPLSEHALRMRTAARRVVA